MTAPHDDDHDGTKAGNHLTREASVRNEFWRNVTMHSTLARDELAFPYLTEVEGGCPAIRDIDQRPFYWQMQGCLWGK
jgi:hypothetical protein